MLCSIFECINCPYIGLALMAGWITYRFLFPALPKGGRYIHYSKLQLPKNQWKESPTDRDKWTNLALIEQHVGANDLRSCFDMVVVHEKISAVNSEYVNLFTVQHNLFAGALLSLSDNPSHLSVAEQAKRGEIRGAFALTERDAGVYSGAVVKTELRCVGDHFELHTPNEGADKVWISYANDPEVTKLIVFAKFIDETDNKRNRIIVPLLVDKNTRGVKVGSYVSDQAVFQLNSFGKITFDHAKVPFSALLNKFVQWDTETKSFVYKGSNRALLYKLFDRLLVGRLVLSASAVHGVATVLSLVQEHAKTKGFDENKEVSNKLQSIESEIAVMQQRLYATSRLLDSGKAKPYQVNLLKAKIPVRCLALVSELGMLLGGRTIRSTCPVLDLHGSIYGSVVAEGDSAIMRQSVMKDIMMTPWLVSWDPVVWALCFAALCSMVGKKDKRKAWNNAMPLLGRAFDRTQL